MLDRLSEYFAARKGLLPLTGTFLVALNFVLRIVPGQGFLVSSDLLLHMGVILAVFGLTLARAL